jgi:hypothetical protein
MSSRTVACRTIPSPQSLADIVVLGQQDAMQAQAQAKATLDKEVWEMASSSKIKLL